MAPWLFRYETAAAISPARRTLVAAVAAALDFFRLLMMIVISGTSTSGSTLFSGCCTMPVNCDCSARASTCKASTAEP